MISYASLCLPHSIEGGFGIQGSVVDVLSDQMHADRAYV